MKVLFAGSPAIAVPSLFELSGLKGIELAGVLTNPDTPKGRSGIPLPTEIGLAAQEILEDYKTKGKKAFPILKPVKLDSAAREQIGALEAELLVSFACGHFFGPKFMALFPLGGINIHPSLLPKYRGATPIQTAILNRDSVTGITVQKLAQEMDGGDILAIEELQLTGNETTGSLSKIVSEKAAVMLPAVLEKIKMGEQGIPQDHGRATHCSLISKDDAVIDWSKSVLQIQAQIRAYNPQPLCRTIHGGRELFILKADVFFSENRAESSGQQNGRPGLVLRTDKCGILIQTGDGILAVTELQYSGKKALFWKDFLNGARDFLGSTLG